eukprot:442415_1
MANKGQSLNEENNMANKGTTSKQWQCTKCTFLNTRNTSQCSMCGNPEQRQSSIEEDNINQICLCGQKVTKYPYKFDECRSCCKKIEMKQKGYYVCNAKQCIHKEMTG